MNTINYTLLFINNNLFPSYDQQNTQKIDKFAASNYQE